MIIKFIKSDTMIINKNYTGIEGQNNHYKNLSLALLNINSSIITIKIYAHIEKYII